MSEPYKSYIMYMTNKLRDTHNIMIISAAILEHYRIECFTTAVYIYIYIYTLLYNIIPYTRPYITPHTHSIQYHTFRYWEYMSIVSLCGFKIHIYQIYQLMLLHLCLIFRTNTLDDDFWVCHADRVSHMFT